MALTIGPVTLDDRAEAIRRLILANPNLFNGQVADLPQAPPLTGADEVAKQRELLALEGNVTGNGKQKARMRQVAEGRITPNQWGYDVYSTMRQLRQTPAPVPAVNRSSVPAPVAPAPVAPAPVAPAPAPAPVAPARDLSPVSDILETADRLERHNRQFWNVLGEYRRLSQAHPDEVRKMMEYVDRIGGGLPGVQNFVEDMRKLVRPATVATPVAPRSATVAPGPDPGEAADEDPEPDPGEAVAVAPETAVAVAPATAVAGREIYEVLYHDAPAGRLVIRQRPANRNILVQQPNGSHLLRRLAFPWMVFVLDLPPVGRRRRNPVLTVRRVFTGRSLTEPDLDSRIAGPRLGNIDDTGYTCMGIRVQGTKAEDLAQSVLQSFWSSVWTTDLDPDPIRGQELDELAALAQTDLDEARRQLRCWPEIPIRYYLR